MLRTSRRLRAAFGAFIDHIDLTKPDRPSSEAVRQALLRHKVVCLRRQRFDLADTPPGIALASTARYVFGPELQPMNAERSQFVQLYVAQGGRTRPQNSDSFHSDLSYLGHPSSVTMLWAIEVPPGEAGDTIFLDAIAACKALPLELRQRLEGRTARHDVRALVGQTSPLNAIHPVIRPHPHSGEEAIYVSPGYTSEIRGERSDTLLQDVFEHMQREEFQMRYGYQPGDFVIWDNAAVQHRATTLGLPPGAKRVMMRVSAIGGHSGNSWWPAMDACPRMEDMLADLPIK